MISRKDVGFYIDCLSNSKSIIDSNIAAGLVELLWELLSLREKMDLVNKELEVISKGLANGK